MQQDEKKKLFEEVIAQHMGILYKVARTYCRSEKNRPDLVQEILMHLWLSLDKYDGRYKITTWMYRISLNVAISFYRKSLGRVNDSLPLDEQVAEIAEHDKPGREEQLNTLEKFINELREMDKALIFLYLEQRSYKEISDILGISESNVATRVGRIKESLKQKFATIKD